MDAKDKMLYFANAHTEALEEWRQTILLQMKTFNPIKYNRITKKINRLDKRLELYILLEHHYWSKWKSCFQ